MKWLFRVVLLVVAAGAIYLVVPHRTSRQESPPALEVHLSARARAMRPGEVVLLTVTTSRDADLVQGGAFGSDIPFWSTTGLRRWQGLVAIPRGTPAGSRTLPVQVTGIDGTIATDTLTVGIEPALPHAAQGAIVATAAATTGDATVTHSAEQLSPEVQELNDLFTTTRPGRLWSGRWSEPLVPGAGIVTVKAPNAGEVVMAGTRHGSGQTIVIEHGEGLYSMFDHLSQMRIATGTRVAPGDVLGEAAAAAPVRWVIRLLNEDVDPQSLVYAADGADDLSRPSH